MERREQDPGSVFRSFIYEVNKATASLMYLLQGMESVRDSELPRYNQEPPTSKPSFCNFPKLSGIGVSPTLTGFDFDLNDFLARNGETEQLAFKGWVEQVYNCIWDSDHRNKLQDSLEGCGIIPPEADPIGDFRRIRNDLIHKHGLASTKNSGKCKVLTWFKPGESIILGMRHVFDFLNQMGMMSSSPAYPPDQILMGTANKATGSYSRMKKVLYYHEGLLDYCLVQDKYTDPNDPRKIGWSLGRQIICQHIAVLNHLSAKLYWLNLGNWKYFFCRMPLTNRSLICSKQVVHTAWVRTKVLPFNQMSSTGFSCGV